MIHQLDNKVKFFEYFQSTIDERVWRLCSFPLKYAEVTTLAHGKHTPGLQILHPLITIIYPTGNFGIQNISKSHICLHTNSKFQENWQLKQLVSSWLRGPARFTQTAATIVCLTNLRTSAQTNIFIFLLILLAVFALSAEQAASWAQITAKHWSTKLVLRKQSGHQMNTNNKKEIANNHSQMHSFKYELKDCADVLYT